MKPTHIVSASPREFYRGCYRAGSIHEAVACDPRNSTQPNRIMANAKAIFRKVDHKRCIRRRYDKQDRYRRGTSARP